MHIFEYSEITVSVPSDIVDTLLDIERIRAFDGLRGEQYSGELDAARKTALILNAGAGCSLEGMETDTAALAEILGGRTPEGYGELVAKGCMDAAGDILDDPVSLEVDERTILHLHKTAVNGTTRRESRFRYRESQDVDPDSVHVRSIRPVRSEDVRSAINQMAESYGVADGIGVRSILLAPCMVLDFLNIQPFSEMNWQVARIMLNGLLVRGGYDALRYVPIDAVLLGRRDEYYSAVAEGSDGWRNNGNDPYPFVRFIAETVLECYRRFESRYPLENGRKLSKSERIGMLFDAEPGTELSKTDVCTMLPDISRRTADPVLTELVEKGRITKVGTFRDARYKKNE